MPSLKAETCTAVRPERRYLKLTSAPDTDTGKQAVADACTPVASLSHFSRRLQQRANIEAQLHRPAALHCSQLWHRTQAAGNGVAVCQDVLAGQDERQLGGPQCAVETCCACFLDLKLLACQRRRDAGFQRLRVSQARVQHQASSLLDRHTGKAAVRSESAHSALELR